MVSFADYRYAIVALAFVALTGLLTIPLTAFQKIGQGVAPGGPAERGGDDPVAHLNHTFVNLTEMTGVFATCLLAAVLSGVAPFWVDLLALVFLTSRLAVLGIQLVGIGPRNFGPRIVAFVFGWGSCVWLVVLALT